MPAQTAIWAQALGFLLALSGWGKVAYDYFAGRPKIRGRIFQVMKGRVANPAMPGDYLTTFTTYPYLINTRRNSIHVLDYELEVFSNGEWTKLDRLFGIHAAKMSFTASDGTPMEINNFSSNLIYRKGLPVEYGKPLHGWIIFTGAPWHHEAETDRYRLTCIDAYRNRHTFETISTQLENVGLLMDLAEISIPQSAIRTSV